jgi:hypothetical protein
MSQTLSPRFKRATGALIQALLLIPLSGLGGALVGAAVGLFIGDPGTYASWGAGWSMLVALLLAPHAMEPVGPQQFIAWFLSGVFSLQVAAGVGVVVGTLASRWFEDGLLPIFAGFSAGMCALVLIGILFSEPPDSGDRTMRGQGLSSFEDLKYRAAGVLRNVRRGPARSKAQSIWDASWACVEAQYRQARGAFYDRS